MDLIKWDEEQMGTGIGIIDSQHKELCKIINSFGDALNNDEDQEVLYETLERLLDYAKYHFSLEEEYFEKFDFSEQSLHKSEHKYFLEYFNTIRKNLDKKTKKSKLSQTEASMDILRYLIEWFITHITGSDREYIELFKKNGVI